MDALTTPSNWQKVRLGDIATFLKGKGLSKSQVSSNAKHECILYGELFTYYDRVITNIKNFTNIYNNPILSLSNDVLMSGSAETPDILATASCILKEGVILGSDILIIRPNSNLLSGCFLAYCIVCDKNQVLSKVVGSTVYHLYAKDLKDFEIPLPPLNEQIAIANILSDVDHYLCSLDALILKKESVKKALSFELLSQRKRLKGFNQAWQRVRLGDICEITTGSLDANEMVHYGKYRFYTCAKEYYFIDKYAFDTEAILISGNGAYVGYVHYYKGKFNAYQRTYVLDNFSEHIIFVKYFLTMFLQSHIQTNRNEGNTPYIVMGTLKDFEIPLPPLNEQIAIANILSALDHEIISLKNKKRQFENIKKALNHDLMSAKIRVLKK
ncbi:restriction endonuclease subunit S [Helicobacter pylori]|uniref:restriction endonuclease subunit S n=1 Tax=Helicobacter pylori TaxID=210 RepID=UPI0010360FA3|nr:restriction endonuclease subunit S [Helicobacter pylori]